MHSTSFDRIVRKRQLDEVRMDLIDAIEGISSTIIQQTMDEVTRAAGRQQSGASEEGQQQVQAASLLLPQNLMCSYFPELWSERHQLMAHFASHQQAQALENSPSSSTRTGGLTFSEGGLQPSEVSPEDRLGGVMLIIGAEHVPFVERQLYQLTDNTMPDSVVETLLSDLAEAEESCGTDKISFNSDGKSGGTFGKSEVEELEKRAAIAAFLVCTRSFPPEIVLPNAEELLPEALQIVSSRYPRYRGAFEARLNEAQAEVKRVQAQAMSANMQPDRAEVFGALQDGTALRVGGIGELKDLCGRLAQMEAK
jgi:hypothetical protein